VQAILGTDPGFSADVKAGRYTDVASASAVVPAGPVTLRLRVQDEWSPPVTQAWRALFVPVWSVVVALVVALWVILALAVFAAAPYVDAANGLVMRRALRDFGSLGVIPLLLAVAPAARRHLLLRYRGAALADPAFAAEAPDDAHAVDLVPVDLMADLDAGGIVRLESPDDAIDLRRYLRYLAGCYAADRPGLRPRGLLPVVLCAGDVAGGIAAGVVRALAVEGGVADAALAARLVASETLLVLADLSETDASAALRGFMEGRKPKDRYCVLTPAAIDVGRKQTDFEMRVASQSEPA
jgi:hypothetical protein